MEQPLIFFGLPEPFVDDVLQHLEGAKGLPKSCLVFGANMQRLSGLVQVWGRRLRLFVVLVPSTDPALAGSAPLILEREGFSPYAARWVCDETVAEVVSTLACNLITIFGDMGPAAAAAALMNARLDARSRNAH